MDPADRAFERFHKRYQSQQFRAYPDLAFWMGGPKNLDGVLSEFSDEHAKERRAIATDLWKRVQRIDRSNLSPENQIDFDIIFNDARQYYLDGVVDGVDDRVDPSMFLIGVDKVWGLLMHPERRTFTKLVKILEQIPGVAAEGIDYYERFGKDTPKAWVDYSVMEAEGGIDLLTRLSTYREVRELMDGRVEDHDRLKAAASNARSSLIDLRDFFKGPLKRMSDEDCGIGYKRYNRDLRHSQQIPHNPRQILAFGLKLRKSLKKRLEEMAASKGMTPRGVWRSIQDDHPEPSELFREYKKAAAITKEIIIERGILPYDHKEELVIEQAPVHIQKLFPFACYMLPFVDDRRQRGWFYIHSREGEDSIRDHNHTAIALFSVHEAHMGHHWQFTRDNQNPLVMGNFARKFYSCCSSIFHEGLALNGEALSLDEGIFRELAEERGLGSDEFNYKFYMLRDWLWRADRLIIDSSMHAYLNPRIGGMPQMNVGSATELLMRDTFMRRDDAHLEALMYANYPGYFSGYAIGKLAITNLMNIERGRQGSNFSIKEFHERLTAHGEIPMTSLASIEFGVGPRRLYQGSL
ncbi:MAG: DUF885 family protein [archaeon]